MKKRLVALLLTGIMLFTAGCKPTENTNGPTDDSGTVVDSTSTDDSSNQDSTEVPDSTETPDSAEVPDSTEASDSTEEPDSSSIELTLTQKMEKMLPVFDGLVRALDSDDPEYNGKKPEFFWSVLMIMVNNFGYQNQLIEIVDDGYKVPEQVLQEYASAAFLQYDDLLKIPADYAGIVEYRPEWDGYFIGGSDGGMTYVELQSAKENGDGTYTAKVDYKIEAEGEDGGETLSSFIFTLEDNPYVSGITNPDFFYSVKSVDQTFE